MGAVQGRASDWGLLAKIAQDVEEKKKRYE